MGTSAIVTGPLKSALPPQRTPIADEKGNITWPWLKFMQQLAQPDPNAPFAFISNTHAARATILASSYPSGAIYYETDRTVWYVAISGTWTFLAGVCDVAQAGIPADLGTADAHLEVFVTDYLHRLRWTGSAWTWAPGEAGSGYSVPFVNAPGAGWHVCDGSQQLVLNADGSIAYQALPNVAGSYFRI